LGEVERLVIELHAPGFDLRHVEDVVDDVQQIISAGHDVVAVLLIFLGAQRPEHAAAHYFREADNGVERGAQLVAHVGQKFRLGLVGFLGTGLLIGILLREFGEQLRLTFQFHLRALEVDDVGGEAHVVVDQLLLMQLDLGDVGADRHIAAVLGAAFADIEPASVFQLGFEGTGAGGH